MVSPVIDASGQFISVLAVFGWIITMLDNMYRFWLVVAGSIWFWIVMYGVELIRPAQDSCGRFWPNLWIVVWSTGMISILLDGSDQF